MGYKPLSNPVMLRALLLLPCSSCLWGQDFSTLTPGAIPGAFTGGPSSTTLPSALEAFSYRLNLNSQYLENANLQQGGGEGAFIFSTGANISYTTLGGDDSSWQGTLSYSPGYQFFLSGPDLPGAFTQNGSLSLSYSGPVFTGNLGGSLATGGGQNVLAGAFVDSTNYSLNGSVSYLFSALTSFSVNGGYTFNEIGGQGGMNQGGGNENTNFGTSLSWQATPLVQVGPYLNFSSITTDNAGSLDSVGYGVNLSYEFTGITSLSGSFGLQDQSFENGGSNTAFFGSLSVSWNPSDLYSVSLGLGTSTVALPGAVNQIANNYNLNATVSRQLGVGSLSFSTSFNTAKIVATGLVAASQGDREFLNFQLSYNRPIFGEAASLTSSIGYGEGTGGQVGGGQNLGGLTSSLGLTYSF